MNIKLLVVALTLLLGTICCNSNTGKKVNSDVNNEVNTEKTFEIEKINPEGIYTSIIPSEDTKGISITLILKNNMSYLLSLKHLGKSDFSESFSGTYTLDENENIIVLQELGEYYKLEKNSVTMLGIDIPQSDEYKLKKVDTSLSISTHGLY